MLRTAGLNKILGARSLWRINCVQWHQIFVAPQNLYWSMTKIQALRILRLLLDFWKICTLLS